jgi:hypothetical protein
MFIEREMKPGRPPCSYRHPCFQSDMALLAEGGPGRLGFYKHCPPDGGRVGSALTSINIAFLTEGGLVRR